MSAEQFDAIMAVNVRGVFLSCQYFGRELLARAGAPSSILHRCLAIGWSMCRKDNAPTTLRRRQ